MVGFTFFLVSGGLQSVPPICMRNIHGKMRQSRHNHLNYLGTSHPAISFIALRTYGTYSRVVLVYEVIQKTCPDLFSCIDYMIQGSVNTDHVHLFTSKM